MIVEKEMKIAHKREVDTDVHQELFNGNWVVLAADPVQRGS